MKHSQTKCAASVSLQPLNWMVTCGLLLKFLLARSRGSTKEAQDITMVPGNCQSTWAAEVL